MLKSIDPSKLPLKYVLRVYHTCPNFPTKFDVLFDLCEDDNLLSGKKFNLPYAHHTLTFKIRNNELKPILAELAKDGYLDNTGTEKSPAYLLVQHPW